jgi:uncharacterized membrane protein YbhN (UPF0104 family)
LKKILTWVLKVGFSLGVLGVLAWKAQQEGLFHELIEHDKNWGLLAVGGLALLCTLVAQFLRWRLLVAALHLRLSLGDALRIGFMAQLFGLVGIGMLGGDALKTFFLGRQNKGRLAEALTTVFIDRVVGLYGLVLLAGIVCLFFDASTLRSTNEAERTLIYSLCRIAPWAALGSTAGLGILLIPGVTTWPAWDALARIPKLGGIFEKLVRSMRMYRRTPHYLFFAIGMSLLIHLLNSLVVYCISLGLPAYAMIEGNFIPIEKPSLIAHATATLLALATGALPVGALEVVFNVIYRGVASPQMPEQQGFLIVLAYRLLQMCIALIGLYYYLMGRREVDELLHEAEEANDTRSPISAAKPAMSAKD